MVISNRRIRVSCFPSIHTFRSMNALKSIQEVDDFVRNCFLGNHCPPVDAVTFKKTIGHHREECDSLSGFLSAYNYISLKTRSRGELTRACMETMDSLERNGCLFSSQTVDYGNNLSSDDHTLLLLLRLSTSVSDTALCAQCIDQIGFLCSSSLFASTSSNTLHLVFLTLFDIPFQREKSESLCSHVSRCILSITFHSQWQNWESLDEHLSHLRDQLPNPIAVSFIVSFCDHLNQRPFQLHLLSSLLLPLVEDALLTSKQSAMNALLKQSTSLASFLLRFLPASTPSLPSRSFLLWTDSLAVCCADSQWNVDSPDSIVNTLVQRLQDSKAFAVQMRCVTILSSLLQREDCSLSSEFQSSLSSALLHLIRRDDLNERVCCRILSLLPTLLPASQRDIATCIVGSLFVRATKRDKDVLTDTPNSLRKQAGAFLLHTDSLSPDNLVSLLLLPMASSLDWVREQEDWMALVVKEVGGSIERIQNLYQSNPLVNRVVDWIIDKTVSVKEKERWCASWDGKDLNKWRLQVVQSCASSLSEETLNKCIESALTTGEQVNAVGQLLMKAHKAELLLPHLESWLVHAESDSLSMELSSTLKALTFLPFSSLQNALIQFSSSIHSDDNVLSLLRLLRVIAVVIMERNEQQVRTEGEVSAVELTLKERNVSFLYPIHSKDPIREVWHSLLLPSLS